MCKGCKRRDVIAAGLHERLARAHGLVLALNDIIGPLALDTAGEARIHQALRNAPGSPARSPATSAQPAARRETPAPIQPALL